MQSRDSEANSRAVRFDANRITIADIVNIADGTARAVLSDEPEFLGRIARGAEFLERLVSENRTIYGVTTGYGDSCTVRIAPDLISELPRHLYTYHGCGLGECFSPEQTRAIIASRLASLCKGFSGVRVVLLEQMARLLESDVLPIIPCEGSVGASGDLTPLSYLTAVLCGEGEVLHNGSRTEAGRALTDAHMKPLRLQPKEALAIMNGTAVMTALACLAYARAEYLVRLVTRITALAVVALAGNAYHYRSE